MSGGVVATAADDDKHGNSQRLTTTKTINAIRELIATQTRCHQVAADLGSTPSER